MGDVIRGGCRCNQLRYESTGAPILSAICHCHGCQRRTGNATGVMFLPAGETRITGDFGSYLDPETTTPIRMLFCTHCGSSVAASAGSYPDVRIVLAASLDDPARFAPRFHMWVSVKAPWVGIDDDLPQFDGHPDWEALGGPPDLGRVSPPGA